MKEKTREELIIQKGIEHNTIFRIAKRVRRVLI
jgi:hypothetical protein